MNAADQTRPIRVGDLVRLKGGGPEGRVMKASAGGKLRVCWHLPYFSNHSAAKLMLAESMNHKQERNAR